MKNKKYLADSEIQDLIEDIISTEAEIIIDWDIPWHDRFLDHCRNAGFCLDMSQSLPSYQKLTKLILRSPELRNQFQRLTEQIAGDLQAAWMSLQEDHLSEKEAAVQKVKLEAKQLSAKKLLNQTLNAEQRKALNEAFNISI